MSYLLNRLGFAIRETGQALDRLGCRLQGTAPFAEEFYRHRTLQNIFNRAPSLGKGAFVAPSATLVGDVQVGRNSSVWYGAVLRGDAASITIGNNTSVQDGTLIRTTGNGVGEAGAARGTAIGNSVTIGHHASLHGATVEDEAMIGIGATLLQGVKVEKGAIVAAGSVVLPGTTVASGQLWGGNPARLLRELKPTEKEYLPRLAATYVEVAAKHAQVVPKTLDDLINLDLAALKA